MKPGVYQDDEDTKHAEDAYWAEHGYTFGSWQFLPSTGEIRRNGSHLMQLPPTLAALLAELIAVYPRYIAGDSDGVYKVNVRRLRRRLGDDVILSVHSWGYKFNPKAVM